MSTLDRVAKLPQIVGIGCSAGGIPALFELLGGLPRDFPIPVVVAQHLGGDRETTDINDVLSRHSSLPVKLVKHEEQIKPGAVYVAPPDGHLLVGANHTLRLSRHQDVRSVRPSVDVLFESVAEDYGSSAIACVLTGVGTDGAAGVDAIKAQGGTVIVQDPNSAEFDGMPKAAVDTSSVDFVLPLHEIAAKLSDLAAGQTS